MMRDSSLTPLLCEPRSSRSQSPNLRIHVGEKKDERGTVGFDFNSPRRRRATRKISSRMCATRPDQTNETPGKSTSPHLSVARLHANPLFLGLLLLGLLLRALLPDAHQAGVGPRLPEQPVGAALDVGGQLALG